MPRCACLQRGRFPNGTFYLEIPQSGPAFLRRRGVSASGYELPRICLQPSLGLPRCGLFGRGRHFFPGQCLMCLQLAPSGEARSGFGCWKPRLPKFYPKAGR